MKRKLALLLLLSMTVVSVSCASTDGKSEKANQLIQENTQTAAENKTQENDTSVSDLDSLDGVEVDDGIFDVEITLPPKYVGNQTQEDLDANAKEHGYKVTLNDDGSATFTMTKKQHKEFMEDYKEKINENLNDLIGSESYPNFTNIEANDNFTEFTITTKSTELDMNESFSTIVFYMYGGIYNIFSGEDIDNISITFVNEESGDIIETVNSSDKE